MDWNSRKIDQTNEAQEKKEKNEKTTFGELRRVVAVTRVIPFVLS